ncbi:MAG TPA: hypothetical protein VIA18_12070 [Polyangia bacterium]|nr:hypothetical protein [Polyangia bacterium]
MTAPPATRSPHERWLPLLWLALAFVVLAPTLRTPEQFASSYDWRLFETWIEAGRRSLVWYHQFPLWNPWTCGGQVYLANPQSLVATPTFPLIVMFGTALGIKLTLVAYHFCAFDGEYRLARDYGLSIAAAIFAAILFGCGGWLALHYAEGHATFLGATLFPYAMFFYRRSVQAASPATEPLTIAWQWTLPLGAIAAWIVGDGGTSTPPMCMVILATLGTIEAVRRRSLRPYLPLVVAGAVAFAVGAVRVLPALEFALDHPRHLFETDANFPWIMIRNAYTWKGIEPVTGKRYWFHEYGWRLPWLTIPLWVWAIAVKRARPAWIFVLVGGAIVAGSAWPFGPWWLLHQLPIFRDLRVPSRYQIFFAIGFPLLCAFALDDLRARVAGRRWVPWLTALVIVVAMGDALAFDWTRWGKVFDARTTLAAKDAPFYQIVGEWRSMMANVFANHGAIGCDEEAPLQRALVLDEGPSFAQVRVDTEGVVTTDGHVDIAAGSKPNESGKVLAVRWTPNRVEADVDLSAPAAVSVNENWNEHWRAQMDGAPIAMVRVGPKLGRDKDGGRLGARVPVAGKHTIAFYYRPRSFVAGAVISLLSIPLAIAAWFILRRRRPTT